MIDFVRALRTRATYVQRTLSLAGALVVAELLYKFHSFTLECAAFLATWLAFDLVGERLAALFSKGFRLDERGLTSVVVTRAADD